MTEHTCEDELAFDVIAIRRLEREADLRTFAVFLGVVLLMAILTLPVYA